MNDETFVVHIVDPDQAIADGMRTMYQDGLNKCLLGITTLEEAASAVIV